MNLAPSQQYFNPFSQRSDSFESEEITDEIEAETSKSKSGEKDRKYMRESRSRLGNNNGTASNRESSKLQGDSGSTTNIDNIIDENNGNHIYLKQF